MNNKYAVSLYNFLQSEGIKETTENVLPRKMEFDDSKHTQKEYNFMLEEIQ